MILSEEMSSDHSIRCINWGGRLLIVGFASGRIPQLPINMALIKGFSVIGVRAGEYGRKDPIGGMENNQAIREICEKGHFDPLMQNISFGRSKKRHTIFIQKEN